MDINSWSKDYNGTYCKNCGHPGHCGVPNYASPTTIIKLCETCRCEACAPEKKE